MSASLSFSASLPEMYERFLIEPLFKPWAAILLGRVALKGDECPRLNAIALVGMTAQGKEMSEDEKARTAEAIANDSTDAIRRYSDGVSLTFDLSSNLATATA